MASVLKNFMLGSIAFLSTPAAFAQNKVIAKELTPSAQCMLTQDTLPDHQHKLTYTLNKSDTLAGYLIRKRQNTLTIILKDGSNGGKPNDTLTLNEHLSIETTYDFGTNFTKVPGVTPSEALLDQAVKEAHEHNTQANSSLDHTFFEMLPFAPKDYLQSLREEIASQNRKDKTQKPAHPPVKAKSSATKAKRQPI